MFEMMTLSFENVENTNVAQNHDARRKKTKDNHVDLRPDNLVEVEIVRIDLSIRETMSGGAISAAFLSDSSREVMPIDAAEKQKEGQDHPDGIAGCAEHFRPQRHFNAKETIEGETGDAPRREIHEDIGEEGSKPTAECRVVLQLNGECIGQKEPQRGDQSDDITDGKNEQVDTAGDLSHARIGECEQSEGIADEAENIDDRIDRRADSITQHIVINDERRLIDRENTRQVQSCHRRKRRCLKGKVPRPRVECTTEKKKGGFIFDENVNLCFN